MFPAQVKHLDFEEVEELYTKHDKVVEFNSIQTQVFKKLYHTNDSVFLGMPSGSGQTTCMEFAVFREI
jgi:pre-mRNA-splicing helicase BRR2